MRHHLFDRIGYFVIKKSDLDALPDWLQQLMSRVIILKAEFSFQEDGVKYAALSPEFELVLPGFIARTYDPVIADGRFLRWSAI